MKIPFEHFSAGEDLYSRIVIPVCERHGLTYMEFTVLMFLANNPRYDTASQIVKVRKLTKSHVSISLRALQERGLVVGTFLGKDHRSIHLKLTSGADGIVADGREAQKMFSEILFHGFSENEEETLMKLIRRIDGNIADYLNSNHEEAGIPNE